MSEITTTDTSASVDTGVEGLDTGLDSISTEELFELQAGKNPDGTALTKKVNRADLLKLAQTSFGANERFEEAKNTKAQMLELAKMMKDPEKVFDVLRQLGHDPDELVSKRYTSRLEESLKSPDQVEYEKLSKDAADWRKYQEKQTKDEEEKSIMTRADQIKNELYTKLDAALSSVGVKPTKSSVAEAAKYISVLKRQAEGRGEQFSLNDIPIEKIAAHLKKQYSSGISGYLDELDDDGILSQIPEALLNKIGAALTKKLTGQLGTRPIAAPNVQAAPRPAAVKKFMSMDDSRGGKNRFS